MTIPRLALGTVQFGMRYGVANQSGRVTRTAAEAILVRAAAAGVDTLDTAVAYGDSEACLGSIGVSAWRIISKLPPLPAAVRDVAGWARAQLEGSLQRLGIERLDALLLHQAADLTGVRAVALRQVLEQFRQEGLARAVGVSIYDPAELEPICSGWRPDLIQAPFNVLDRRLAHSGWLDKLAHAGVRVHVRSVFLQGLLLMPAQRRPASFGRWDGLLDDWLRWCQQRGASPLECSLAFARARPEIERIVVGVDSVAQLEEILAAMTASVPPAPEHLSSRDCELIEPRRWSAA